MYRSDDLDELLGAYALDAVDDDERRAVDQYLLASPRARAEVMQHREAATFLAFSGAPAPDGLWDRIASSLDERAPAPGPELAKVLPLAAPTRRRERRVGMTLAGAVAAAAIGVLGIVAYTQHQEIDDLQQQAATSLAGGFNAALADPAAAQAELLSSDNRTRAVAVVEPDGTGFLNGSGLPELPAGRTYQLWGVVGDQVISLGVLGARPDVVAFAVTGELSALVLTEEERGGVPVSSNPPALVGELS